jgi:hypothetical protein
MGYIKNPSDNGQFWRESAANDSASVWHGFDSKNNGKDKFFKSETLPNNPDTLKETGTVSSSGDRLLAGVYGDIPSVSLWTPESIITDVWFDASDSSTITEIGGRVSQLDDKSNNAVPQNIAQGVGSEQPQTGVDTLNGLNVLTFDEAFDEGLQKNGWDNIGKAGSFSVFTVGKMTSSTNGSFLNLQDDMHTYRNRFDPYGKRTSSSVPKSVSYTEPSSAYILNGNARYDVSHTLPDSYFNVFINGTQEGVNAFFDNPLPENAPSPRLAMMTANNPAITNSGIVAEVIITEDIDEVSRQRVEGYLAWKWGLVDSLPSNHPYKNKPPYITSGNL